MNPVDNKPDARSPARRIVDVLTRRGPMTVAELVEAMGVTTTAVRQQVNRMASEGWLVRTKRRGGTGRPADVLSVSARSQELYGQQADQLCKMVFEELAELDGSDKVRLVLKGVSRRLARQLREAVGSGTPFDRLHRLAAMMSEQGILVDAGGSATSVSLTVHTCPFPDLVGQHPEICDMERSAVSQMIGSDLTLDECMLTGHAHCRFRYEPDDEMESS